MHRARLLSSTSLLFTAFLFACLANARLVSAAPPGTTAPGVVNPDAPQAAGSHEVRRHFLGGDDCLRAAAAGVAFRNAGTPITGGTITLPPGPALGNIVWAGLYWSTLGNTPPPNAVTVNGIPVTPVGLGVTASPCWPESYAFAYFADVTGMVDAGPNLVSGFDDSGIAGAAWESEGASLVAVFRDPTSTACEIIVMDGNILFTGTSVAVPVPVSCGPGVPASLWFIGGDGQAAPDAQSWNGVPLGDGDDFDNSDPQTPGAFTVGWDTDRWGVLTGGANVASVDFVPATSEDCINWLATVIEVGVRAANQCQPTDTRKSSWGSVKIRYR